MTVYEQGVESRTIGAGIHLSQNALTAMQPLRLTSQLLDDGFRPTLFTNIDARTGRKLLRLNRALMLLAVPSIA